MAQSQAPSKHWDLIGGWGWCPRPGRTGGSRRCWDQATLGGLGGCLWCDVGNHALRVFCAPRAPSRAAGRELLLPFTDTEEHAGAVGPQ